MTLRELAPLVLILVALIVGPLNYLFWSKIQAISPSSFWVWSILLDCAAFLAFWLSFFLWFLGGPFVPVHCILALIAVYVHSGFSDWMDTWGKMFACYQLLLTAGFTALFTSVAVMVFLYIGTTERFELTALWFWSAAAAGMLSLLGATIPLAFRAPEISKDHRANFLHGGITDDLTHES